MPSDAKSSARRLLSAVDRDTAFRATVLLVALGVLGWLLHQRFFEPWYENELRAGAARELADAEARFAEEVWSLDPEDHLREPVPDRENIAHWAVAGAAAVVDDGALGATLASVADSRSPAQVDPGAQVEGIGWNEPALSLLRRMGGLERSTYELDYTRLGEMILPDPAELHRAAALLHLDVLVATEDRIDGADADRILRDLRSLDAFALSLRRESSWDLRTVAGNVERLLLASVRRALLAGIEPARLAPFVAEDESTRLCENMSRTLAWEAASDLLVRPEPLRLGAMQRSLADEWAQKHFLARYDHHAAEHLELLARRIHVCQRDAPFWDLVAAFGVTSRIVSGRLPVHWLEQAPAGFTEYARRRAADRRLGRVALEVRRLGLVTGTYPTSLDAFDEAATDRYLGNGLMLRRLEGGGVEIALRQRPEDARHRHGAPAPWRLPPL